MKLSIVNYPATLVILALYLSTSSVATAQDSDKLKWSITPYVWAPTTKVDLDIRDTSIGSGEIGIDDLLDTLDSAFIGHLETGKGNWSGFADMTYLSTSDRSQRPLLTVDIDSEQLFIDAALAYWPAGVGSSFNMFGGVRYTSFDDELSFSLNGAPISKSDSNEDYYDVLWGLRYRFDLSERWELLTHGDFSVGDSEGTYLLKANFSYIVGKRRQNRVLFGYQYKQAKYRDGDLTKDFTFYGPMAGFNFRF